MPKKEQGRGYGVEEEIGQKETATDQKQTQRLPEGAGDSAIHRRSPPRCMLIHQRVQHSEKRDCLISMAELSPSLATYHQHSKLSPSYAPFSLSSQEPGRTPCENTVSNGKAYGRLHQIPTYLPMERLVSSWK